MSPRRKTDPVILYLVTAVCFVIAAGTVPRVPASEAGTLYLEWIEAFDMEGFGVDTDLAVLPDQRIFIIDPSSSDLWHLQAERKSFAPVPIRLREKERLIGPASIEADKEGRLWIAYPYRHEIIVTQPAGPIVRVFGNTHLALDRLVSISKMPDGQTAVWDSGQKKLLIFSMADNTVFVRDIGKSYGGDIADCLSMGPETTICLDENRVDLIKIRGGKIISKGPLLKTADKTYIKIADMNMGPEGYLYLTDALGRHLFYLSTDLELKGRFPLYESLFKTPKRFAFGGEDLWLIDEGRKELMHFRLRNAVTEMDHRLLGEEYLSLGFFEEALLETDKAEALGGKGADLALVRGKSFYGLKKYEQALSAFLSARRDEDPSAFFFWTGNALFRLGRYGEAAEAYRAALPSVADKIGVQNNLGQTWLALNRYDDAEHLFRQIVASDPGNRRALLGLGRAYMKKGITEKAIGIFERLAKDQGSGRNARHYLGLCYMASGKLEQAVILLKRSAAEGPYYMDAFRALAEIYQRIGDFETAGRYRQKGDRLEKNDLFDNYLLEDAML